jgi:hypothetical protein
MQDDLKGRISEAEDEPKIGNEILGKQMQSSERTKLDEYREGQNQFQGLIRSENVKTVEVFQK